jgi:hypothetical protein
MACLLLHARDTAAAARRAGQDTLDPAVLDDLVARYRAVAAGGLWTNLTRHTATARDARAIARRFLRRSVRSRSGTSVALRDDGWLRPSREIRRYGRLQFKPQACERR